MTREKAVDPEGDKLTVTVSASTAASCARRAGRGTMPFGAPPDKGGRQREKAVDLVIGCSPEGLEIRG